MLQLKNIGKTLSIVAQIVAYILAIIIIVQLLKSIYGGTWEIENVILALVAFNFTLSVGITGYLFNLNNSILHLNNRISEVDKTIHGHLEWHKAKNN